MADVFQNSNFCLKALILYGIKFCWSKWQAHFICFWENRYKYPCLNNYSLLLFQVKIVFHEKNNQLASSAHTSITQIFFFKTNIIVWYAAVVSYNILLILSQQILKKKSTQASGLMKLTTSTASWRIFLNEISFPLPNQKCKAMKNMTTGTIFATVLICTAGPGDLCITLFVPLIQMSTE